LTVDGLRRYLVVAHFGRGRGEVVGGEDAERWREAVTEALANRREKLVRALQRARDDGADAALPELEQALSDAALELLRA